MNPILYYDNVSPPVRSVLMTIEALKAPVDLKQVLLFNGEHLSEEFVKMNPLHTVPALKYNNLILTDSHAIIMYLCDVYGKDTPFSLADPIKRAKVMNRLCFNQSVLFRRDADVMHEIFFNQLTELGGHAAKISEAYNYLEIYLSSTSFVADDELTIADFSIVGTLSTLDLLMPVTKEEWPQIFRWFSAMQQYPFYKSANQVGLDNLKEKFVSRSKFIAKK